MAFKWILLISVAIALGSSEEGKRLIKYDPKEPAKWMTVEEMKQLLAGKTNGFIDLTRKGVDMTPPKAKRIKYTYPDGPNQTRTVYKLISDLQKDNLEGHVRKLSSFHSRDSRYYFGESEAEGWLISEIKRTLKEYKGGPSLIQYINNQYDFYKQQNIIVKLQGNDSILSSELIVLGAHYDTISIWDIDPTMRLPGADDNASGCVVLLEALRLLVKSGILLKHTVEFHFYTANGLGMIGSQEVVQKYFQEGLKVKGMLNVDSVGYGNTVAIVFGYGDTDDELTTFVYSLMKEYTDSTDSGWGQIEQIQRGHLSDHSAWDVGYPAAFLCEKIPQPYHLTEKDTIETINFKLVSEFTKVAVAFVIELGEPINPTPPPPAPAAAKLGLERMKMEIMLIWCGLLYFFN